jgi:hypothetical protein
MARLLQRWRRRPEPFDIDCSDIAASGSVDYPKLASGCTTENTFNRLHIELENICTPRELAGIAELSRRWRFPKAGRRWLERLRRLSPEVFDTPPRPYERRALDRQIFFYGDPKFAPGGRGLLIGFTGGARRLLLPIPIILQFIDPAAWDVLLVSRKAGHRSYLQGFEGISEDFPGLVAHIERLFGSKGYAKTVTLGTSAGGFPAVWAARLLGALRGISACGSLPKRLPADAMREKAADRRPDLCFVYGAEYRPDADAARAMHELYGGRLFPIPDADTHAIFKILLRRNKYSGFIEEMLR